VALNCVANSRILRGELFEKYLGSTRPLEMQEALWGVVSSLYYQGAWEIGGVVIPKLIVWRGAYLRNLRES